MNTNPARIISFIVVGCFSLIISFPAFSAKNVSPVAGFTFVLNPDGEVVFTDTSTDSDGSVISWSWDFGDGNSSTVQNPFHTYSANGDYVVTLAVSDDGSPTKTSNTNQTVMVSSVSANTAPVASFNYVLNTGGEVVFTDTSTDPDSSITLWSWDFGDGNVSTDQNPVHRYASNGDYTVSLTVTDNGSPAKTGTTSDPAVMISNAWPLPTTQIVYLRKDCSNQIDCFEVVDELENWMNNLRFIPGPPLPTPSLLVNIGPGTFSRGASGLISGVINCFSDNITLQGSGRNQTIITTGNAGGFPSAGLLIGTGCDNFSARDLKFYGLTQGVVAFNVTARTTWTNVEVEGGGYGWLEAPGICPNRDGRHTWNTSRIVAQGLLEGSSFTYTAFCAQSWFFGSEIVANVNGQGITGAPSFAVEANDAEVHLYGSNARLIIGSGADADNDALIRSVNNAEVHIHGTGLDIIHDGVGAVDFLEADVTSTIHASESGFSLQNNGTGTVERLSGTGNIESPYRWGQRTSPPAIFSRTGADIYVETDCPSTGHCSAGDGIPANQFPHTMIYRAECTGTSVDEGPWYDTTTNACRQ